MVLGAAALGVACGDSDVPSTPDAPSGPQCSDGIDNDGDGQIDYPDDLGCDSPSDDSEDSTPKPQCDDGRDNDGDGKTDYPNDPGCFASLADSEEDDCPDGPNCPQCANGIDDDGNGQTDFPDDPGCTSASDLFEFTENPVACGPNLMIKNLPPTGTEEGMLTTTSTAELVPSCGGVANAPAIAYQVSLTEPKVLVANTNGSTADTVLSLRRANCTDSAAELACHNDISASNRSSTITVSLAAGHYYLIVSGATANTTGAYVLNVAFFTGEGETCVADEECGPGLVCRTPVGETEMQCAKPVCSDGRDDDGDGKIDFPNDPGCDSPEDDDESDDCPDGQSCPACGNGIDDDNDGLTDYPDDPSCTSASGTSESCMSTEGVIPLVAPSTSGTTAGATNDFTPTCASSTHSAPDVVYQMQIPAVTALQVNLSASFDTAHALLDATCQAPALACSDPLSMNAGARPAGTYYVVVDGWGSASGTFTINVSGTIANGESCEAPLAQSGALTCGPGYACQGTVGSRTCQPAACNNGMDDDGDGLTDYPNDPGCDSTSDNDETDDCPSGPSCPVCSNGIDDDNDGLIDYPADPNCSSAAGTTESCTSTEPVEEIVAPMTSGTTVGAANDFTPSCGSSSHSAPDLTYLLQLPAVSALQINVSGFDTAHYLLGATCQGPELACSDPPTMNAGPRPAGNYYLVVDGWGSTSGSFTVTVSGTIAPGGSCEVPLAQSGALTCPNGYTCGGPAGARTCQPAACNNGVDDDGDGLVDAADPGCESLADDDETDPTTPGACSNGIDDDADMLIDFPQDYGCATAGSDTEVFCMPETDAITLLTTPQVTSTTSGGTNNFPSTTCISSGAVDKVYALQLPVRVERLTVSSNATWDQVLSLRDITCGTELVCADANTTGIESFTAASLEPGTYAIVVDGWGSGNGSFTMNVHGEVADGASCEGPLFDTGLLTCGAGATCAGPMGARTCVAAQCSNGVDDDGDGLTDFPNDPGCATTSDNDETDDCPSGPNCPACSNGIDDDNDGLIDYPADSGCRFAGDDAEYRCTIEDAIGRITSTPITGSTVGMGNQFSGHTCQSNASGPDVVYELILPVPVQTLVLDLSNSSFDTVISFRNETCSTQLGCDDDSGTPSTRSKLTQSNVPAGAYHVVIDGWSGASGNYILSVQGTVAAGTACDSPLFASGVLSCPTGTTCGGSPAICQ